MHTHIHVYILILLIHTHICIGVVNVTYMSAATLPHIKPFMDLAETIGAMHPQMADSPIAQVTLKTWYVFVYAIIPSVVIARMMLF